MTKTNAMMTGKPCNRPVSIAAVGTVCAIAIYLVAVSASAATIYLEEFTSAPVVNDQVNNGNSNYGGTGAANDMNQDEWYTRGTLSTITHTNGAVEIDDLGTHVWYLMDLTDIVEQPESNDLFRISFDVESITADVEFWAFAGGGLDYNGTAGGTNGHLFFRMHGDPPLYQARNEATGTLIADTTISTAVTNTGTFTTGVFDLSDLDNPGDYVAICFGSADNEILTIGNLQIISEALTGTVVTVEVPDPDAAEEGSDPGTIRISRGAETNGSLDVYYTLGGTADTNDYTESHMSPATIPDGTNAVDLVFTPVDDALVEGDGGETIEITIDTDAAYTVGLPGNGEITIAENDLTLLDTIADGNWTNPATWNTGTVPDAGNTADIKHAVTIDSTVSNVDHIVASTTSGSLTLDAGSLTTTGGTDQWFSLSSLTLTNGANLSLSHSIRFGGGSTLWIVDGSTFNCPADTVNFRGSGTTDSLTLRNGGSVTIGTLRSLDSHNVGIINIEGSGNTINIGTVDESSSAAHTGEMTFKFVMDDTVNALTTFQFGTLDLDSFDFGTTLIVDATAWNGAKGIFTLFSGTTIVGAFDDIQFIGINAEDDAVTYDYDNGEITLDIAPQGMVFVVK